jgi:hypothetical protein
MGSAWARGRAMGSVIEKFYGNRQRIISCFRRFAFERDSEAGDE